MKSLRRFACASLCLTLLVAFFPSSCSGAEYSGAWQSPVLLEDDNVQTIHEAALAVGGTGVVFAVWYQTDGATVSVYCNRYVPGSGWLGAEEIDETSDLCSMPEVACDDEGNALVVWSRYDEGRLGDDLVAKYHDHEHGWGSAEVVNAEPLGDHSRAKVAADPDGDMVVVWVHDDLTWRNVSTRTYERGVGWSSITILDDADSENAYGPQVAIDGSGAVTVVWEQGAGSAASAWAARREADSGWSAPVQIGSKIFNGEPLLDVAANGNATCTWAHYNSVTTKYEIYAANYVRGLGWGSETALYTSSTYSAYPTGVGVDRDGNALVMSELWDSSYNYRIMQTVYEAGYGWSPSFPPIGIPSDWDAFSPKVSVNDDGDALVAFGLQSPSMPAEVWGATFGFESGWGVPVRIGPELLFSPSMWDVDVDDEGNGMAIMLQPSGVVTYALAYDLWASRFTTADTSPPSVSISSPIEGATVEQATVTVSGTTEPGATLAVNGVLAAVNEDGTFSVELSLVEGENEIVATATDSAGNSASDSVTVTFISPLDDLAQDLEDALSDLDELSSELNQTKDSLTGSGEELDDANSRIDSLADKVSLLTGLVGVLAALVILLAAMYVWSRKRSGGSSHGGATETVPPPPE